MKIAQPVLNTALRGLRLVKPGRMIRPLDCVLLHADGPTVALTTTNLDEHFTFTGELVEPSPRLARLIPLAILQRIAKELPKETIYSFEKDRQIACHTGNLTTLVNYEAPAPNEFPPRVAVEGPEIELPAAAVTALQEARQVASDSETRRNIRCVCMEPTGAVATDGRQLFHSNTLALPIKDSCLFPIHKPLSFFDGTAPAFLRLPGNKKSHAFTLRQGAWTWQSLFVDEVYPNWRKVLPDANEVFTEVKFSREDADHLRQIIGLIPHDPRNDPVMALVIRGRQLFAVIGKAEEAQTHELHPVSVTGPDAHAWFNAYFLLQAMDYGFDRLRLRNAKTVLIASDQHREYLFMPYGIEDDKLPTALRPPMTTAPEQNKPTTTHTETNPTNHQQPDPMPKTTTATAPDNAPEAPMPTTTTTTNGQPQPVSAADRLMSQWLEARESARVALERLDAIRGSLKHVAREYRELEREHEALKKNVRSLQKLEV